VEGSSEGHLPPDLSKSTFSYTTGHYLLMAGGFLLLLLLFFADKTALHSTNPAARASEKNTTSTSLNPRKELLPPLAESQDGKVLRRLDEELQASHEPAEQKKLLQNLVSAAHNLQRLDYAALYQEKLYILDSTSVSAAAVGSLFAQAADALSEQKDSALYNSFNGKAIVYYEKNAQLNPDNQDIQVELGTRYVKSGDPAIIMNGIRKIREVATKNPSHFQANLQLGIFSIQTGQFEKAEARLRQAIAAHPQSAEAYYYLGKALFIENKKNEARTALKKAASLTQDEKLLEAIQHDLAQL